MLVYTVFILILFVILCSVKKEKFTYADLLLLIVLICFSGLRYRVGTDFYLYEQMYLRESTETMRTGYGYYILSILFFKIFPNSISPLIFVISLITNIYIYKFCKKNSVNPAMSIFIYICLGFYTMSFNIFRQMLSVAFFVISYNYLEGKKYLRYVIFCIFAILIHTVALLPIVIVFIFKIIWKKKLNFIFIVISTIILILGYKSIYGFIVNNISSMYIYTSELQYNSGLGTYLQLFVYGMFLLIVHLNSKRLIERNYKNKIYINIFSVSYMIMFLGINHILFMRLSNYLSIFIVLLIPELYYIYGFEKNKDIKFICYIILIIYFLLYVRSFGGVVPYNSVLKIN